MPVPLNVEPPSASERYGYWLEALATNIADVSVRVSLKKLGAALLGTTLHALDALPEPVPGRKATIELQNLARALDSNTTLPVQRAYIEWLASCCARQIRRYCKEERSTR
jgi:hypothetical protein